MQQLSFNDQVIWFEPSLLTNIDHSQLAQIFEPEFWQQREAIVGSACGRGTTWFVQLEQMQAALRHYRRGGLFGKLVKDSYYFTNWGHTRGAREIEVLAALTQHKVHVPRAIAARAVKHGFFYRADILSERIPNAKDLVEILVESPLAHQVYYNIGVEIKKMHQAGVNHTDLNIHNILLDEQQKVWLIDFDKCGVQAGDAWKAGNLARLQRSFIKELNKCQIHWQQADWQALLDGYNA
ncbi:3-deoxy-D-manno-octulosonic acid kinase [Vibrio taketomensis]|uniref:3-deoxy-D-manno-octulosonic acid kinase n=1 Tax=Vibrio taketomensis TaxID=2572923 RepID=UPI00138A0C8A|nr:3-deoxy-D-manno-octulosonic acid kinase [Vibrio taketomensis]